MTIARTFGVLVHLESQSQDVGQLESKDSHGETLPVAGAVSGRWDMGFLNFFGTARLNFGTSVSPKPIPTETQHKEHS